MMLLCMVLSPPPSSANYSRMSAKIGAECPNWIAISPWTLNLNSKSNKVWKNAKEMTFLWHVLFGLSDVSLQDMTLPILDWFWKNVGYALSWKLFIYSYPLLDLWEFDPVFLPSAELFTGQIILPFDWVYVRFENFREFRMELRNL